MRAAEEAAAELRGEAERRADARIGELDLWGRYRVTGVGTPPYAPAEPPLDED